MAWVLPASSAHAVELITASTDGKASATRFSVAITSGTSTAELASVPYNTAVTVKGRIVADPLHANKTADVFLVDRMDNTWYMRDPTGRWVVWSGRIPDLVPAKERVNLGSDYTIDIY